MKKNIVDYASQSSHDFLEAIINLLIFFPYFFSVTTLLRTLFLPWKSLISKKTSLGFSFDEWMSRTFFNGISKGIGFIMRMSILLFYLIFQTVYFVSIPFLFLIFCLFIPIRYIRYLYQIPDEITKKTLQDSFVKQHCIKQENIAEVLNWFESYYQSHIKKTSWWKLSNLFSTPPLARDWAVGFTPTVDQYATELTQTNYQNNKKHIVGRLQEIKLIEDALSKTNEANVIICGEEGIGKHTIVDALAKKMYEGKTSHALMYKRILKLDMEKILTEFTDQKQREHFFDELLKEVSESHSVILLIENIDRYVSSHEHNVDLTGSFEKFGKSASVQIIGITTPFLYEKIITPNDKIRQLYTKIDVKEVSKQDAFIILRDLALEFESIHKVQIVYETLIAIIEKSDFYLTTIPFPEKAVELLDSCCIYATHKTHDPKSLSVVTPEDVDIVLSEITHVPTSLTANIKDKLLTLEEHLTAEIVQQSEAVQVVCSSFRRSFVLIGKRKKPIASFLFLGPTGVGKTQTAKAINKVFFGEKSELIRFDMSLYQSKTDIVQLIGSMETNNPGLLTSSIREHPYGVLLLDEIEKANKELLNIFLTILDEGYYTDGYGKRIDCKNLVIVATSNAGADFLYQQNATHVSSDSQNLLINHLIEQKLFSPEFLNRFDGVVVYKPLSQQSIVTIAKQMLKTISEDVYKLHKIHLEVSDEYITQLAEKGYDPKFGARNMERLIRSEIEDKVAKMILENHIQDNLNIILK